MYKRICEECFEPFETPFEDVYKCKYCLAGVERPNGTGHEAWDLFEKYRRSVRHSGIDFKISTVLAIMQHYNISFETYMIDRETFTEDYLNYRGLWRDS